MPPTADVLGVCPHCGATILPEQVIIEYETADDTATYAECPDCTAVVHPTQ